MNGSDTFTLEVTPPFRLDLTVWALRRRPANAVDRWDGEAYRRVISLDGTPVDVAVRQTGPTDGPSLAVDTTGLPSGSPAARGAASTVERILGLGQDLTGFYRLAASDPLLGPLAVRFQGMRAPRLPTVFEALVNAVSCQQLSLTVGIVLLNRLTEVYGRRSAGGTTKAFPEPDDLARGAPDELRKLGYSHRKGAVLVDMARQVVDGTLDLDDLAAGDDTTAVARLCQIDGVGRWSAEYVMLRGLGRLHVFPGDDIGARNKLTRWLNVAEPLDYRGVGRIVERWAPYAGLVYFHLLLDSLDASGWLAPEGIEPRRRAR